jgi:uncharacterized protein (TIGR03435 family)
MWRQFGRMSLIVVACWQGSAQQPAASRASFDVASIRLSDPNPVGDGVQFSHGNFRAVSCPLMFVIEQVYNLRDFQIAGGPQWISDWKTGRYDIYAKTEAPSDDQRLRLMAQELLGDRFKLRVHREKREVRVYVLTVARKGLKVQRASSGNRPAGSGGVEFAREGLLRGENVKMSALLQGLARFVDRPILDETNFAEPFDFRLEWALDEEHGATVAHNEGASLFTAVEEQLGLTLLPRKRPVDVLIIDHVERPSEN